ncbi:MAG: hypothetical protein K2K72_00265, partial [Duncaniella sp.]|nr:hypothetical protein [Duncaniella sp.]
NVVRHHAELKEPDDRELVGEMEKRLGNYLTELRFADRGTAGMSGSNAGIAFNGAEGLADGCLFDYDVVDEWGTVIMGESSPVIRVLTRFLEGSDL